MFNLLWAKVEIESKGVDVDEPQLSRARKIPKRYEIDQSSSMHWPYGVYFEALDLVINAMQLKRFKQPGYKMYVNPQKVPLKAAHGMTTVMSSKLSLIFMHDFNPVQLRTQSQLLTEHFGSVSNDKIRFRKIVEYF